MKRQLVLAGLLVVAVPSAFIQSDVRTVPQPMRPEAIDGEVVVKGIALTTFAAALTAATASTDIYVTGMQSITSATIITQSGLRIWCQGGAGFNISSSGYVQASASGIEFHGCDWTGTTNSAPIYATANGFVFENNIVSGFSTNDGGNGELKITQGDGDAIHDNHFTNNVNNDIVVTVQAGRTVSNLRVTNNYVGEIVLHTTGTQASLSSVAVANNLLRTGQNGKTEFGIEVGGFGGNTPTDVTVTSNTVTPQSNGTDGGISIAGMIRCAVMSNTFNGAGGTITVAAFEIAQATDCSVSGNAEHGSSNFGYKFDTTSSSTLNGNVCDSFSKSSKKSCFWIGTAAASGAASNNTVVGNTCIFPSGGAGSCIWQQADATGALVENNLYADNTVFSDGTPGSVGIKFENDTGTSSGQTLGTNTMKSPARPYSFGLGVTFSKIVEQGTKRLSGGLGSVAFSPAFDTAPVCVASDTSNVRAVKASASRSALTLAGSGNDTVAWRCSLEP